VSFNAADWHLDQRGVDTRSEDFLDGVVSVFRLEGRVQAVRSIDFAHETNDSVGIRELPDFSGVRGDPSLSVDVDRSVLGPVGRSGVSTVVRSPVVGLVDAKVDVVEDEV